MTDSPPNVLSIAGSDPSGGAGLQADLKSFAATGAYGMAALTALTAQNTQGVSGVHLVPAEFVAAQIDQLFADVRVDAVKIGMIATADIARAVAAALARNAARKIVLDPVMIATSGDRLLADDAVDALASALMPLAGCVTPNLPEAAALAERPEPTDRAGMTALAAALRAKGARAVFLKGGHLDGPDSPDLLSTPEVEIWFEAPRRAGRAIHGGGCTLSSALAARWAATGDLAVAARQAKAYVDAAIESADRLAVGAGARPLDHLAPAACAAARKVFAA